jgi:uncharacterized damage-inducible protein DinB
MDNSNQTQRELPQPWLDRNWADWQPKGQPLDTLSDLRHFPTTLIEILQHVETALLVKRLSGKWSIQEHVGHLLAIESLWIARLDDFVLKHDVLRPWNGHNNDVEQARFNEQNMKVMLRDLLEIRSSMVDFSTELIQDGREYKVWHQRLNRHFTLGDQLAFIQEHDRHHLQIIRHLIANS